VIAVGKREASRAGGVLRDVLRAIDASG